MDVTSGGPITPGIVDPGGSADCGGPGDGRGDLQARQVATPDLDTFIDRRQSVQGPTGLTGLQLRPGRPGGRFARKRAQLDQTATRASCYRARRLDGTQTGASRGGLDTGRHLLNHGLGDHGRGSGDQLRGRALDGSIKAITGVPKSVGIHDLDPQRRAQARLGGRTGWRGPGPFAVDIDGGDGIGQVLEAIRVAVDHAAGVQGNGRNKHHDWTKDEAGRHKPTLARQDLPPGSQAGLSRKVNPFIMAETDALPVVRNVATLRETVSGWRRQGFTVGFVPTMGALHEGHLTLVREAGQRAERVVASVFVNPTQFAAHEDLGTYPRQEARDAELLAGAGCDLLFAPAVEEMYPSDATTTVNVGGPAEGLEGDFRPQMFGGVALVVAKLLNQVQADVAVFGEKDWQQLAVVRRLVRDLDIPTAIVGSATVRDGQGLALSSRNAYLSPTELEIARHLNGILADAAAFAGSGGDVQAAEQTGRERLLEAGFATVDYVAIRRADDLTPYAEGVVDGPGRILAAARLGRTRLIDNMEVTPAP